MLSPQNPFILNGNHAAGADFPVSGGGAQNYEQQKLKTFTESLLFT